MKARQSASLLFAVFFMMVGSQAHAATKPSPTPEPEVSAEGEAVDVSKVTEKYWAQGKDTELGVVQNRKYTSEHRVEFDLFAGTLSTNPFLSVHNFGASLGYYFNQNFSVHLTGWYDSVNYSSAYDQFKASTSNASIDLNRPKGFLGAEVNENVLYGKASLFGAAIIYVDIYVLGGGGVVLTDSGNNGAGFLGLGQKIHLNKYMSLNLDYRVMFFSEHIPSATGGTGHNASNTTDAITLGLGFFY